MLNRFGIYGGLKKLTNLGDNVIDWTRTGELLLSEKHTYSKEEIMIRGSIVLTTAAFAILGCYLNKNKPNKAKVSASLAYGFCAFVLTHGVAIIPIIRKRYMLREDC